MIRFCDGPGVLVTIRGPQTRVLLSLSDTFSCVFINYKESASLIAWLEHYAAKIPEPLPSFLSYTKNDSKVGKRQEGPSDFEATTSGSDRERAASKAEKSEEKPQLPKPTLEPRVTYNSGSFFQKSVMEQMARIDFGVTITYGMLAERLGDRKAARAVGRACNKNPMPLFYPCHRVIGTKGLGGFAVDIEIKKRLLDFERNK